MAWDEVGDVEAEEGVEEGSKNNLGLLVGVVGGVAAIIPTRAVGWEVLMVAAVRGKAEGSSEEAGEEKEEEEGGEGVGVEASSAS